MSNAMSNAMQCKHVMYSLEYGLKVLLGVVAHMSMRAMLMLRNDEHLTSEDPAELG